MKTFEYKDSEVGRIPFDWTVKQIGKIGYTYSGLTGKGKDDFGKGESRYITFLNVLNNPILKTDIFEKVDVVEGEHQNKAMKGDLFFNTSSETPEEVGICSLLYEDVPDLYLNSFCFGFRLTDPDVDGLYLSYFFRSKQGRDIMSTLAQGATRYNLSKEYFNKTLIAFPPLSHQKKIAKSLSEIDDLIAKQEDAIEKKQLIKEGLMQELLTGKKRLKGFSGEWATHNFDYFIERFATGLNPRSNFKLNDGGYNYYVTIKDFIDGRLYFEGCDRIDDEALKRINERSDLKVGDILFSSIGRIGDAYVITKKPSNWNINESVFSLRPKKTIIDSQFLYYLIKSREVQDKFVENTTGSTLKSVKMGHLKLIECYFPNDIKEQKAIAETLKSIDSEIIALQSQRDKYLLIKQGMMQELLTGKTRLI